MTSKIFVRFQLTLQSGLGDIAHSNWLTVFGNSALVANLQCIHYNEATKTTLKYIMSPAIVDGKL